MIKQDPSVACVLIADDLTGACDTGVQFVRRGLPCRVEIDSRELSTPASEVVAFNTNSRGDEFAQSQRKIEELGRICTPWNARVVLKKIDSTLRGNIGCDIVAALRAFNREAAIIAPAYPAMQRWVRDGILHWVDCRGNGQINISGLLASQGISKAKIATRSTVQDFVAFSTEMDAEMRNGKQFFVVDCTSQADLSFLVSDGLQARTSVLWVGSGGLGIALADSMAMSSVVRSYPNRAAGPILFIIGSAHPVTHQQKKTLLSKTNSIEVLPHPKFITEALMALREECHVVISVESDLNSVPPFLRAFFVQMDSRLVSAIFLSGGDTAALVCAAIEARSIDLRDELEPGFPWGVLEGGMFGGTPVACKSGAFGDEGSLLRCAKFFAQAQKGSQ
jgi:D-threonate/D-erythronate kinase